MRRAMALRLSDQSAHHARARPRAPGAATCTACVSVPMETGGDASGETRGGLSGGLRIAPDAIAQTPMSDTSMAIIRVSIEAADRTIAAPAGFIKCERPPSIT